MRTVTSYYEELVVIGDSVGHDIRERRNDLLFW